MVKNLNVAKMGKRVKFGTTKSKPNNNGVNVPVFEETFSCFFGSWRRSLSQSYTLIGTELEDSKVIYIRRDDRIELCNRAMIDGKEYTIALYDPDENDSPTSFDLITLKKVK